MVTRPGLLVEVGQVGADGGGGEPRILGLVDADGGEDRQRLMPVVAGVVAVAEGQVSVREAVVGTRLVDWLVECGGQLQRGAVVGAGYFVVPAGMVGPAEAVVGFEPAVAVTDLRGDGQRLPVAVGASSYRPRT